MSTTFEIADLDVLGFAMVCACGAAQTDESFLYPSYQEAVLARENGVTVACGDEFCGIYPAYIVAQTEETPQVNMSNINAGELFFVLGMGEDSFDHSCGSIDASDFLGRVLMALAVNQDVGIPVTETITAGGARFIDCGREDGYVEAQLLRLQTLAERALEGGHKVQWT